MDTEAVHTEPTPPAPITDVAPPTKPAASPEPPKEAAPAPKAPEAKATKPLAPKPVKTSSTPVLAISLALLFFVALSALAYYAYTKSN